MRRMGIALLAAALVLVSGPAVEANHRTGAHWKRSTHSFTLRVVNSTLSNWSDALVVGSKKWSDGSAVVDIRREPGPNSSSARSSCSAISGRVRICNHSYGGSWAALTSWSSSNGHIQWVTIKLNDRVTDSSHRRAVMCHELGHALGLGHRQQSAEGTRTNPGTCLTPKVHPYQTSPDAHDFKELENIYLHRDGSASALTTVERSVGTFAPDHLLP
jgi:hypothetical protein